MTIPGSVTETYGFDGCTSLTSVIISNGVTVVGGFNDCTSLTSVTIPDSVTEFGGFNNCTSLTSETIPDSVTEIWTSYGAAFDGCTSLNAVYKGKSYDYENIDLLYDAINMGETGLKIEDGALKDVSRALTEVIIPNSVTEISDWAFSDCKRLTSVTIPDSVTKIGEDTFSGCTSLKNASYKGKSYDYEYIDVLCDDINLKTDLVIEDGVLEDVSRGLTEVVIPDNVTKISGYAFSGCTRLTSVTIPDSVTEIGYKAFEDCTSLTRVAYKGKIYDGESASGMFIFGKTFETYKIELGENEFFYKDYPYLDLPYMTISFLSDEKCEMTISADGETMTQELQYTLQKQSIIFTDGEELQIVNGRELLWDMSVDDDKVLLYLR